MRYINLHFTYFTYLLTKAQPAKYHFFIQCNMIA